MSCCCSLACWAGLRCLGCLGWLRDPRLSLRLWVCFAFTWIDATLLLRSKRRFVHLCGFFFEIFFGDCKSSSAARVACFWSVVHGGPTVRPRACTLLFTLAAARPRFSFRMLSKSRSFILVTGI